MARKSEIIFKVELDDANLPEKISWEATDESGPQERECKSAMISLWDPQEKTTLRIDLWTKDFRMDEMTDHFFQTLITMAESYQRATRSKVVTEEMKKFCEQLSNKINEEEQQKQQQGN